MKRFILILVFSLSLFALHPSPFAFAATPVITRAGKGAPLTWQEGDTNIINLRDAHDNFVAAVAAQIAAIQQAQSGGTLGYTTKALMDADLAHDAGALAKVTNDSTPANNGDYIKLGASGSGSWQKSAIQTALPLIDARIYADFATAVAAQGTTPATLVISTVMPVTTAVAVQPTLKLLFTGGGYLSLSGSGAVTGLKETTPEMFGAAGDGTTDDSLKIQQAISALDTGGTLTLANGKTYLVDATQAVSYAGGTMYAAVTLLSNITIEGNGATVKAKASISPTHNFAILFSNQSLSKITVRNTIFDINGENNLTGGASNQNAAIMFSGNSGSCDDLLVENNQFINYSGTSVIITAQPVYLHAGDHVPVRNKIIGNRFYTTTAALDTLDHSAIYFRAEDSEVSGNTFELQAIRSDDVGVACEIQGKGDRAHHNKIINYFQGFWVTNNFTNDVYGVHIDNNDIYAKGNGIDFSRVGTGATAIYDITINNNTITIEDTSTSVYYKTGIQIATPLSVRDVVIDSNLITKIGTNTLSAGLSIGNADAGQKHKNIIFSNNKVQGTYIGASISPSTGAIGDIFITGNKFIDLQPAASQTAVTGITVYANGVAIDAVTATGNSFIDTSGSARIVYGNYIATASSGTVGYANFGNDYQPALSTAPYSEAGTMATTMRRYGYDALASNTLPTSGYFTVGQFYRIPNPAQYGSTPNKYTILGWDRLTTGTNNVDGTDWVQRRALTGN